MTEKKKDFVFSNEMQSICLLVPSQVFPENIALKSSLCKCKKSAEHCCVLILTPFVKLRAEVFRELADIHDASWIMSSQ